eukprot:GEMP01003532.1.p1 GENE.GEMP01003532.1~~GEMP01003532.1.p1  ORF type:complete len:850 (+),score=149.66 GEMP01003532.1:147-2696(+)
MPRHAEAQQRYGDTPHDRSPRRPEEVVNHLDTFGTTKWRSEASERRRGVHVDYMVVFPNPALTTDKEEERFRRLTRHRNVRSAVDMVLGSTLLEREVFDIEILRGARSLKEFRLIFLHEYLLFLQGNCAGTEWELFLSIDRDEIFVQHYLREESAKYHAETQRQMVQLDATVVIALHIGQNARAISPAWIPYVKATDEQYTEEHPRTPLFNMCHATYFQGSPFRARDRIQLLRRVIDMYMNLRDLERFGLISGYYACHQRDALLNFSSWTSFKKVASTAQPIEMVRDYFGTEVAFYFCWVQYLTNMLLWLAIPGIILQIRSFWVPVTEDTNGLFLYCIVIALWSSVFSDLWLQAELRWCTRWGVEGVVENHIRLTPEGVSGMRPDYSGEFVRSEVNSFIKVKRQPLYKKLAARLFTKAVTSLFLSLVVICVTGIFLARHIMAQSHTYFVRSHAQRIGSFVNACQIKVFDFVWARMAVKLCEWENYQTDHEWKEALIWKMFLFRFVNTFNSIFYIAFVQRYVDGCPEENCIPLLRIQIFMVFGMNTMLSIVDIFKPWLVHRWHRRQEDSQLSNENINRPRSFLEDQNKMLDYSDLNKIDDYMVVMFQFGFVVMFGNVVPIIAFVALVSNLIQIRADAWKLCNTMKRPFPHDADGIGVWRTVQTILSWLGVFTNIGICIFSLPQFDKYSFPTKLLLFFLAEHAMILLKLTMLYCIPAVPRDVQLERKRREHVLESLDHSQGSLLTHVPDDALQHHGREFPRFIPEFQMDFIDKLDGLNPGDRNYESCLDAKTPNTEPAPRSARKPLADNGNNYMLMTDPPFQHDAVEISSETETSSEVDSGMPPFFGRDSV